MGTFEARTDVLRRNKSAFVFFYIFILFVLHANASIGENKVKKDVENIGYGGKTATNTGYLKSSDRWHLIFRQFLHITQFLGLGQDKRDKR